MKVFVSSSDHDTTPTVLRPENFYLYQLYIQIIHGNKFNAIADNDDTTNTQIK